MFQAAFSTIKSALAGKQVQPEPLARPMLGADELSQLGKAVGWCDELAVFDIKPGNQTKYSKRICSDGAYAALGHNYGRLSPWHT